MQVLEPPLRLPAWWLQCDGSFGGVHNDTHSTAISIQRCCVHCRTLVQMDLPCWLLLRECFPAVVLPPRQKLLKRDFARAARVELSRSGQHGGLIERFPHRFAHARDLDHVQRTFLSDVDLIKHRLRVLLLVVGQQPIL